MRFAIFGAKIEVIGAKIPKQAKKWREKIFELGFSSWGSSAIKNN